MPRQNNATVKTTAHIKNPILGFFIVITFTITAGRNSGKDTNVAAKNHAKLEKMEAMEKLCKS
jgi:hypothetical protein